MEMLFLLLVNAACNVQIGRSSAKEIAQAKLTCMKRCTKADRCKLACANQHEATSPVVGTLTISQAVVCLICTRRIP